MAKDLLGYDGAVNGVAILRGIAVAPERVTGSRERSTTSQLEPSHMDQQVDVQPTIQRVLEVIGSREEAMRWLGTPVRALDYATPISRLCDPTGREEVLSVLSKLEHGVL
jgi:uncharacterized protein (DUF2384 family)